MENKGNIKMKRKTKIALLAAAPLLGLGLLGANLASAHGFGFGMSNLTPDQIAQNQQTRFQNEANLLGVSVDEVKAAWASGKTLEQLASEKGISQTQLRAKIQAERVTEMKARLQTLVDKGVITQAQADSRLQFMQSNIGKFGRGMGMHRGFGLGWNGTSTSK